jgi:hypothetical protein
MNTTLRRSAAAGSLYFALLAFAPACLRGADALTWEQKEQFLLHAKQVGQPKTAKKGVTETSQITLSDGKITHDASVQTIDEYHTGIWLNETNFKDTYKCYVAAWKVARLLGIGDMVPTSVVRGFQGKSASYTWWIDDVQFDEQDRQARKVKAPDQNVWNQEYDVANVFEQLIRNMDFNQTNILIDKQWRLWMIDHGRSFRLQKTLNDPTVLTQIDRNLLAQMKTLDKDTLKKEIGAYVAGAEIDALLARRDVLVKFFEAKGESALFDRPKRD